MTIDIREKYKPSSYQHFFYFSACWPFSRMEETINGMCSLSTHQRHAPSSRQCNYVLCTVLAPLTKLLLFPAAQSVFPSTHNDIADKNNKRAREGDVDPDPANLQSPKKVKREETQPPPGPTPEEDVEMSEGSCCFILPRHSHRSHTQMTNLHTYLSARGSRHGSRKRKLKAPRLASSLRS